MRIPAWMLNECAVVFVFVLSGAIGLIFLMKGNENIYTHIHKYTRYMYTYRNIEKGKSE